MQLHDGHSIKSRVLNGAEKDFGERVDEEAQRIVTHARVVHQPLHLLLCLSHEGCVGGRVASRSSGRLVQRSPPAIFTSHSRQPSRSGRGGAPRGVSISRLRIGRSGQWGFEPHARADQVRPEARAVQELPTVHQLSRLLYSYIVQSCGDMQQL